MAWLLLIQISLNVTLSERSSSSSPSDRPSPLFSSTTTCFAWIVFISSFYDFLLWLFVYILFICILFQSISCKRTGTLSVLIKLFISVTLSISQCIKSTNIFEWVGKKSLCFHYNIPYAYSCQHSQCISFTYRLGDVLWFGVANMKLTW